ncbi:hypothetical protein WJX72_010716 [[Myrmecia] bisecta]|uniref:EF-hand domain-containing protein n=1 Tax=[Myrmecia] bisecta TaxID=41462 RepID=A0AAW1PPX3_9CHLO
MAGRALFTRGPEEPPSFSARPAPRSSHATLDKVDSALAITVAIWLRKHGRTMKPKLSEQQKRQLKMCFSMMDEDGSGAIDAGELGNAFKLLGIAASPQEIKDMLDKVDADGSGEVEYPEFVEIMTNTLNSMAETSADQNLHASPRHGRAFRNPQAARNAQASLPFEVTATAYRRKKLIEALKEGNKDLIDSMAQSQDDLRSADAAADAAAAANIERLQNSRMTQDAGSPSRHVTGSRRSTERVSRASWMDAELFNVEERRVMEDIMRQEVRREQAAALMEARSGRSSPLSPSMPFLQPRLDTSRQSTSPYMRMRINGMTPDELRRSAPSPVLRNLRARIPDSPSHQLLMAEQVVRIPNAALSVGRPGSITPFINTLPSPNLTRQPPRSILLGRVGGARTDSPLQQAYHRPAAHLAALDALDSTQKGGSPPRRPASETAMAPIQTSPYLLTRQGTGRIPGKSTGITLSLPCFTRQVIS